MLYEKQNLPELYFMKHVHDDNANFVNYEKTILNNTLSPHLYENDTMNTWLNKLQSLVSILFDQMNIMKNLKNYMVDKYEYRQR